MKRELKFRSWDKKWKRWIDPADISIYGDGTIYGDRRANPNGDVIETATDDELEIMQFTGLKDKNGREIYEGDILKGKDDETDIVGVLEFWRAAWWIEQNDGGTMWQLLDDGPWEIIGNIYENPELMRG